MSKVHPMDEEFIRRGREHILKARRKVCDLPASSRILEVGPAEGMRTGDMTWDTIDISPGCDLQGDITKVTPCRTSHYDAVLCLDVLEHTLNPFAAIAEMRRVLKPGGLLIASAPLNVRIHGPANDCWRFTEHGIRVLMRDWDGLEVDALESERFLFPCHYNWKAICNKTKRVTDEEVAATFRFIT